MYIVFFGSGSDFILFEFFTNIEFTFNDFSTLNRIITIFSVVTINVKDIFRTGCFQSDWGCGTGNSGTTFIIFNEFFFFELLELSFFPRIYKVFITIFI